MLFSCYPLPRNFVAAVLMFMNCNTAQRRHILCGLHFKSPANKHGVNRLIIAQFVIIKYNILLLLFYRDVILSDAASSLSPLGDVSKIYYSDVRRIYCLAHSRTRSLTILWYYIRIIVVHDIISHTFSIVSNHFYWKFM